jgi:L-iditol 2-dehydrogenase
MQFGLAMDKVPNVMQAVVYRGANDLRVEEVPVPRIGARELLVRVAACGICPTDIKKVQYGTVPPPRIFGHETSGVIVKVGARVRGFRTGQRVGLHHHVPCLKCHACRHRAFAQCAQYKRTGITAGFEPAGGGFAQYVRVMDFALPGVVKIPSKNSFEEAAMLEPVNTVLKAVRRLALLRGDFVLVTGQGPIGLMFTRLLTLEGYRVLATDLVETRLQFARDLGAFASLRADDPEFASKIAGLTKGHGLDAAVVCAPVDQAVRQAQGAINGAGKVLLFAHTRRGVETALDLSTICVDEKDLIGSYSSDLTLQSEVARIVFSRKLDVRKLITHTFPLEQTANAVALAAHPTADSLKILVEHGVGSGELRVSHVVES